jgi:hypothetical protein
MMGRNQRDRAATLRPVTQGMKEAERGRKVYWPRHLNSAELAKGSTPHEQLDEHLQSRKPSVDLMHTQLRERHVGKLDEQCRGNAVSDNEVDHCHQYGWLECKGRCAVNAARELVENADRRDVLHELAYALKAHDR